MRYMFRYRTKLFKLGAWGYDCRFNVARRSQDDRPLAKRWGTIDQRPRWRVGYVRKKSMMKMLDVGWREEWKRQQGSATGEGTYHPTSKPGAFADGRKIPRYSSVSKRCLYVIEYLDPHHCCS